MSHPIRRRTEQLLLVFLLFFSAATTLWADIAPDITPLPVSEKSARIIVGISLAISAVALILLWTMAHRGSFHAPPPEKGHVAAFGYATFFGFLISFFFVFCVQIVFNYLALLALPIGAYAVFKMLRNRRRREMEASPGTPDPASVVFLQCVLVFAVLLLVRAETAISESYRRRFPGGRIAGMRSNLQNLKTALLMFRNDVGRYPHLGTEETAENVERGMPILLGTTMENSILCTPQVSGAGVASPPMGLHAFEKRWRGPYMDAFSEEMLRDFDDQPLLIQVSHQRLVLHSKGSDNVADPVEKVLTPGYTGDDIVVSVGKIKPPIASASSAPRDESVFPSPANE